MDDPSWKPWSDDPYAPQIPYYLYFAEKTTFAGNLIGAIFFGIIIAIFFQCLNALLNPVNRPGTGIKWPFVAHTIAMFSFVTVIIVMCLGVLPVCYIDNREFPGGYFPVPGPLGYYASLYSKPIDVVPKVMFLLNYCLADGLLLYRCYIIYGKNYLVIVFPCLMYITSCGVGIAFIYQVSQRTYFAKSFAADVGIPYFSTSAALNVLLTLMIAVRLILHSRKTQSAMGAPARVNALYKTIVAMLVESCALYTVSSLLFIIPWAARSWVTDLFSPILTQIQVIAPFLIILRAAKQSVSTTGTVIPTSAGSIRFGSQRSTDSDGSLREGGSTT